ncbi:hypothetical protein IKF15_01675 [Candidatus Saccharibacteria bacterium]|nr:hypothetical protein [Candidatus Saccharibacteria bacterium]
MTRERISPKVFLLAALIVLFAVCESLSLVVSYQKYQRNSSFDAATTLSTVLGIMNSSLQSGDLATYQSARARFDDAYARFRDNPYIQRKHSAILNSLDQFNQTLTHEQAFLRDLLELRAHVTLLDQQSRDDFAAYVRSLDSFRTRLSTLTSPQLDSSKKHYLELLPRLSSLATSLLACENICSQSVYEEKRVAFAATQAEFTDSFARLESDLANTLQLPALLLALSDMQAQLEES